MIVGTTFGDHQIVISVDVVNMRCFGPHRTFYCSIPENVFFTDQLHIFDIELLKKYFGVSCVISCFV